MVLFGLLLLVKAFTDGEKNYNAVGPTLSALLMLLPI